MQHASVARGALSAETVHRVSRPDVLAALLPSALDAACSKTVTKRLRAETTISVRTIGNRKAARDG